MSRWPDRADQGPRAQHGPRSDRDDRERPVPDRRRGRHQHRQGRDLGDPGPLRRHPHRRRQGPRERAQPRDPQVDHGRRRAAPTWSRRSCSRPRRRRVGAMRLAALTLVLAALRRRRAGVGAVAAADVVAFTSRRPRRSPWQRDVHRRLPGPRRSAPAGGRDGGRYLRVPCGSPQRIRLRRAAEPRRVVRAGAAGRRRPVACGLRAAVLRRRRDRAAARSTPAPTAWTPVVLGDPTGAADASPRVRRGAVRGSLQAAGRHRRRDVLADLRPARHDDHPASPTRSTFGTNHPLGGSFGCGFDGAAARRPAPARSR